MTRRAVLLLFLGAICACGVACLGPVRPPTSALSVSSVPPPPVTSAPPVSPGGRMPRELGAKCPPDTSLPAVVEVGLEERYNHPSCLVGRNRCGSFEPLMARYCRQSDDAMAVEQVLSLSSDEWEGRRVELVGYVGKVYEIICTAMGCDPSPCCNRCHRSLLLEAMAEGGCKQIPIIRSRDVPSPLPSLECVGDDSMLCCNDHLVGRAVQVAGVIVFGGPPYGPEKPLAVLVEDLCVIEEPW